MKLVIEINVDNAAFEEEDEIERILSDVASRLPLPPYTTCSQELQIHDRNGNWVGYARIGDGEVGQQ